MCGRYVAATPASKLAERLGVDEVRVDDLPPRWNVAPTLDVPTVATSREGQRVLASMRWGLVPSWAKDPSVGSRMINARAETLADKPAFRRALAKHRCLIPADGFYEWQRSATTKKKQPSFISAADGSTLVFAGLWEAWRDPSDPEAQWLRTCTIVTTAANRTMAKLHDRMPVILPPAAWATWLDRSNDDVAALGELLVPAPAGLLVVRPVSTLVNNVKNEGAELLDAPSDELVEQGVLPLG